MLDRVEHRIMSYIFARCKGKKTQLMAPSDILSEIANSGPKYELTAKQLEIKMKNLMLDGYIEIYHSDNKGTVNYVVKLTTKGEANQREIDDIKAKRVRSLGWKILLTVVGVGVAGMLGLIIGNR